MGCTNGLGYTGELVSVRSSDQEFPDLLDQHAPYTHVVLHVVPCMREFNSI